jgi:hypothetical protein
MKLRKVSLPTVRFLILLTSSIAVSCLLPAPVIAAAAAAAATAECQGLRLSQPSAMPLDTVFITGVPKELGAMLAGEVISDASQTKSLAYVERRDDGRVVMHTPLHPDGKIGGGAVSIRIFDGEGGGCQSIPFRIAALPAAPGKFKEYVDLVEKGVRLQAEAVGTTPEALSSGDVSSIPLHYLPLAIAQQIVDGAGNSNSLRAMAAGNAPLFAGADASEWALLDALLAKSKAVDRLRDYIEALEEAAGEGSSETIDAGIEQADEPSVLCQGSFYRPDAPTLERMMSLAVVSDLAVNSKAAAYLDAASLTLSAGGILAGAAGPAGKRLAAIYSGAASAVFTHQKGTEAMDGLLPSSLVSLEFDYSPARFDEDDEVEGRWSDAMLLARSKGWSADKAVLEGLLHISGKNALGGLRETRASSALSGWFQKFGAAGDTAAALASGLQNVFGETVVGEIIKRAADGSGVLRVPPCDFGPTDISDEEWSEAEILDAANAPAELTGHGLYRVRATGEAYLLVRSKNQRFGFRTISKSEPIVIAPIEIAIDPGETLVEPGAPASFSATVENARNDDLEWSITPAGKHLLTLDGSGTSTVRVTTSGDPDDYPAILRATSTATLGLRGAPGRPDRFTVAVIRPEEKELRIESILGERHGLPDEKLSFDAVVRAPRGSKVTYNWDFGDGSRGYSGVDVASASHTWGRTGTFTLALTVRDTKGASDRHEVRIRIHQGLVYTVRGAAQLDVDTTPHGLGGVTGWMGVPAGECTVRFWSSSVGNQQHLTFAAYLTGGVRKGIHPVGRGYALEHDTASKQKRIGSFFASIDWRESADFHSKRYGFGSESGSIAITSFRENRVAGEFDIEMSRTVTEEPSLRDRVERVTVTGMFVVKVQQQNAGSPHTYYNCVVPGD